MPVIQGLFEEEKTSNIIPDLFEPEKPSNVIPDLFPKPEPSRAMEIIKGFPRGMKEAYFPEETTERAVGLEPVQEAFEGFTEGYVGERIPVTREPSPRAFKEPIQPLIEPYTEISKLRRIVSAVIPALPSPAVQNMFITATKTGLESWRRATEVVKAPLLEHQIAVRTGKKPPPIEQTMSEAIRGLRVTPGREIVKQMGVPLDEPEWVLGNPVKHFLGEMLGAWYETYGTDPIIMASWAKSVPYARKAHLYNTLLKETEKKGASIILGESPVVMSPKLARKMAKNLGGGYWGRQVELAHGLKNVTETELKQAIKAVKDAKYVPRVKPKLLPTLPAVAPKPTPKAVLVKPTPPVKPTVKPVTPKVPVKQPWEMTQKEFAETPIIKYIESAKRMSKTERDQLSNQLVDMGLMSIDDFNYMTDQFGRGGPVTPVSTVEGKPIPSKPVEGDFGEQLKNIAQWHTFKNVPLFAHRKSIIRALVDGKTVSKKVIDSYKGWGWILADGTTAHTPAGEKTRRGVTLQESVESYGVKFNPGLITEAQKEVKPEVKGVKAEVKKIDAVVAEKKAQGAVTVFPTGKENVLAEIKEAIKKAPGTLRLGGKGQAVETYEKEGLLSKETPTWFAKDPAKGDLAKVDLKIDGGLSIVNDKAALWEVYQKVKTTAPKLPAPPKPKKISVPKGKGREAIVEGFKKDLIVYDKKISALEREKSQIKYDEELKPEQKKVKTELLEKDIAYYKKQIEAAKENIRLKGIKPTTKPSAPSGVQGIQPLAARTWQVEMPKEPEIKAKINKTQIMTWTEKAFKIPIRGKATRRMKAPAWYETKAELIRMKIWGELEIVPHEVAHHLDKQMRKALGTAWRRELIPKGQKQEVIKELADLDYDQRKRRTSEGFAEYIRYLVTTNQAPAKAPKFHKFFTEIFLKNNPDIKHRIFALKKMMETWQKQGAENRIIQHIDFKGEHIKVGGVLAKFEKAKEWILKNFNDEFYYPQKITKQIEKLRGKKLKPTENPATMMAYYKSKAGIIARTFVMEKAINEYGKVIGPGLKDVLAPIPKKDINRFLAYGVAKRAILKMGQGKETGIDIDDAKYIVEKYKNDTWDEAIKGITEWSNHLIDRVVKAGGLSKESAKMMRDFNPIYLPFKRAFIDELAVIKGVGGYVNRGEAIKRMKGSGRPIINPLETMISQTTELISKAQKVHIAKLFADLSQTEGVGGFITKVPPPMEVTKFKAEQIKDYLLEMGAELPGGGLEELDDFLTVFTQGWQYKGKDNIVTIWRGGKREFYEIHPELYRALTGIDMLQRGPVLKVLAPFARILRLGATGARIAFGIAKNPARDALTYAGFSKSMKATPFDPIAGAYKDITATPTKHPLVWRFKAAGGELSTMMGFDRAATQRAYDDLLLSKLGKIGKVLKVAKHPLDTIRQLSSIPELAPRTVELERQYKTYLKKHPDWSEEDAFVEAFNDAQDVTINFTKSGYYAKRINEGAAFFNVAIRGPEKFYRAMKERPIQTIVKGLAWITAFALWNWNKNKDKQWYKNLPYAYKYNNFWFEIGDTIYRLPIPFDLGMVFASAPQMAMDLWYYKSPKAVEGFLTQVKAQFPDPTPSAFKPAIDIARNKNWLDIPIETAGLQRLPVTERRRQYTREMSVALSKGANSIGLEYSPIQIDHLLNSYTGGWVRQIPLSGIRTKADIPVLGELILRMPENPRRQMNEFYLLHEVLSQKKNAEMLTREERIKFNNIKPLYSILSRLHKSARLYKKTQNEEKLKETYVDMQKTLENFGFK